MAKKNNEIDIFSIIKEEETASIAILTIHRMHQMLMLHVFNVALFEGCETLRGRMYSRKSSPDLYSLLNKMHNPLTKLLMPLINSIDNAIRLIARTKGLHHELLIADKALVKSSVLLLKDVGCEFSVPRSLQTSLEGLSRYFPSMLYLIFTLVVLMEKSEQIISETSCKVPERFNPSHEKYRANTSLDILCTLYLNVQRYSAKLNLYRKDNYQNTYY